jgi:hypothetical protein
MKFRSGFVSNSSSSSYICEVCGDTFEAWDEGISHFDLVMCEDHDHLFCEDHRVNPEPDGTYTMLQYEDEDDRISSKHCPLCQLKEVNDFMLLVYALKKLGTNSPDLKREIQDTFENYDELDSFITGFGTKYGIELTAHMTITAANKELAYKQARNEIMKNPVMLDVTHCEEL